MRKKLMLACMAIAAFAAFVIAPSASANHPTLTDPPGTPLLVGASVTVKNTGNTTFTGAFNVNCDHVHLTGTVVNNNTINPTVVKIPKGWALFNGTAANTDCTSALGAVKVTVNSELCVESVTNTDSLKTTGCGANVTFTLEITGTGPCKYSTASVTGTATTNSTPATVTISEQKATKEEGGFFCPSEGKLDMDFDLYTTNGVGITIS